MTGARDGYRPVAWDLPAIAGETFTTVDSDARFLAALKRERRSMHSDFTHAPARNRTRTDAIARTLPANGTCPTCGTRLAFGCSHHPLIKETERARPAD